MGKSKLYLLVIIWFVVTATLTGCKTTKYVPVDSVSYRDVIKHDTLQRMDSVYVHDSICIIQKGDTVFRDRWHQVTAYKEIYKNKTDSFIKVDSVQVPYPVEKQLTKWEQFQLKYSIWSMGVACALLMVYCVMVYKRVKNAKSRNNNQ